MCAFLQALLSTCVFLTIIPNSMDETIAFMIISTIGIICSLLIGAILAIIAKNQMSVGPVKCMNSDGYYIIQRVRLNNYK